jgi:hypothetical protein
MYTYLLINVSLTLGQAVAPSPGATPANQAATGQPDMTWVPITSGEARSAPPVPAAAPQIQAMPMPPQVPAPAPRIIATSAATPIRVAPPAAPPTLTMQQDVPPPVKEGPIAPTKEGPIAPAPEKEKEKAKEKEDTHGYGAWLKPKLEDGGSFFHRLYRAYYKQYFPGEKKDEPEPEPPARRAPPEPWHSPPFPGHEYQGYPLLGVPEGDDVYPFMEAVYGGPFGDAIKDSKIKFDGWVTTFGAFGTAKHSNTPDAYWVTPNTFGLDQIVMRFERLPDTVQTDHIDWGFRSIGLYGIDYRYTMAGGYGEQQLTGHNLKYGWDPVEQYFDVYVPGFLGGTDIRAGRWIACPDIETQYAPDNYMGSHSLLFTYDTYTQTGVMVTQKINSQLMVQGVLHSGTDMAPWYPGALWTAAAGVRYVMESNNDAWYTWANALNSARFRHFYQDGQDLGHDNFNYVVTTWEHRFNDAIHTNTETYYMWQFNAEAGGTPSAGPSKPFGGGGGNGTLLPGQSNAYGVLNFTMFALSDRDYFTIRNEWYCDDRGMRTGYSGNYTSHAVSLSHQFNDVLMVRPEIGYYSNWTRDAFDNGTRHGIWIYGFDLTMHF